MRWDQLDQQRLLVRHPLNGFAIDCINAYSGDALHHASRRVADPEFDPGLLVASDRQVLASDQSLLSVGEGVGESEVLAVSGPDRGRKIGIWRRLELRGLAIGDI